MPLPLEGTRVLDLTVYQHGPYASTILASLGADVIKVEEPQSGDPGRYAWYSREAGLSSFFEAHNHGKRSITLDLKHAQGRDVFLRLAAGSDVLLHNFRIGAVERLGLDYDAVAKVNPRIVYVQASAYGPSGDERDAGAFDYVAQARSGFASTNGEPDDPPLPSVVAIGDQSGALHACIAALAGLAGRNATGKAASTTRRSSAACSPCSPSTSTTTCSPAAFASASTTAATARSGACIAAATDDGS